MPTPLLELRNIGKIYVSEGNVAVGIRGVNLSFDRGEFVAVTGKSGSGKSTLLNVLSGMDTYEEGELLICGEPTSHYLQSDWEEYRKQYISFIFQEYNIIESFTVLQNVELALMNISDRRARRARALELLRRVGLEKFIHHKEQAVRRAEAAHRHRPRTCQGQPHHSGGRADRQSGQPDLRGDHLAPARGLPRQVGGGCHAQF